MSYCKVVICSTWSENEEFMQMMWEVSVILKAEYLWGTMGKTLRLFRYKFLLLF